MNGYSDAIHRCITILVTGGLAHHHHSGASLLDHLLGTAALLESWQCNERVVLAGLTHTLFSSAHDPRIQRGQRESLVHIIGPESLRLAILYSLRAQTSLFQTSKCTAPLLNLQAIDLFDLAHLSAANLLDQFSRVGKAALPPLWPTAIDLHLCPSAKRQVQEVLKEV